MTLPIARRQSRRYWQSENKYRTLLENLPQKIFLKDKNSVYISCNENYARDMNIKPEEIAGKTDYDFYPKELAEKYRADDKRVIELGQTQDIEEAYLQEGREFIVHTVKTPVKDEEGNVTRHIRHFLGHHRAKEGRTCVKTAGRNTSGNPKCNTESVFLMDAKVQF